MISIYVISGYSHVYKIENMTDYPEEAYVLINLTDQNSSSDSEEKVQESETELEVEEESDNDSPTVFHSSLQQLDQYNAGILQLLEDVTHL